MSRADGNNEGETGEENELNLRALEVMEAFLLGKQLPAWAAAGKSVLCRKQTWENFGEFMANEYLIPEGRINSGDHMSPGMVDKTMRRLMRMAQVKLCDVNDVEVSRFFRCLDHENCTTEWKWWKKTRESGLVESRRPQDRVPCSYGACGDSIRGRTKNAPP
mmetsp:Transcript_12565/g.15148  ORF Transcript_12565/g.15148 Transcript_12565/m.15148 type:complete len:162 (+) Transcript_12565:305-790(+)